MSKASKLDRMKNTVLETTGLTYNTSGQTVELNFTPDVTNPGVSVPLVLAGGGGVCVPLSDPIFAIPYAVIEDVKPSATDGGDFYNSGVTTGGGFQMGTKYFRTRDLNTRVFDSIGVSINPAITSTTNGGPGNSFSLPLGTYRICATTTVYRAASVHTILCKLEDNTDHVLIGNSTYNQPTTSGTGAKYDTNLPGVKGIFTVSSESDRYAIAQACQTSSPANGFGVNCSAASTFENVYTQVELWKLR